MRTHILAKPNGSQVFELEDFRDEDGFAIRGDVMVITSALRVDDARMVWDAEGI